MSHDGQSNVPDSPLKGATASIFLAMVLHPGPQTVKSLQLATGYSFKPVRSALTLLESRGLVRYETQIYAWVLQSGTPLLRRLRQAISLPQEQGPMAQPEKTTAVGETAVDNFSTELSTTYQQVIGESPDQSGENAVLSSECRQPPGKSDPAADAGSPMAMQDGPDGPGENPVVVGESPGQSGKSSVRNGQSSLSRAPITTTANSSKQTPQEKASKQAGTKRTQRGSAALDGRQSALFAWLARGGIGPNSPKMHELLACDLDLETVQAHVLELQACKAGLVKDQPAYSAGLLIRKLLDGDPPPPLRCEYCLQLPSRIGLCRCDLEKLIKR